MKHLRITVEGKVYDVEVELLDEDAKSPAKKARSLRGVRSSTSRSQPSAAENKQSSAPETPATEGAVLSPLSAVVVSLDVAVGDTVEEGQKVITLEAMKMNTTVPASAAGTVEAIHVAVGDAVEEGQALITVS